MKALKGLKQYKLALLASYTVDDILDDYFAQNAINRSDLMSELEKIDEQAELILGGKIND